MIDQVLVLGYGDAMLQSLRSAKDGVSGSERRWERFQAIEHTMNQSPSS